MVKDKQKPQMLFKIFRLVFDFFMKVHLDLDFMARSFQQQSSVLCMDVFSRVDVQEGGKPFELRGGGMQQGY